LLKVVVVDAVVDVVPAVEVVDSDAVVVDVEADVDGGAGADVDVDEVEVVVPNCSGAGLDDTTLYTTAPPTTRAMTNATSAAATKTKPKPEGILNPPSPTAPPIPLSLLISHQYTSRDNDSTLGFLMHQNQ